ncbi:MAG: M14 family zinc carboxypeptidase [Desulfobacter sp.]
MPEKKSFYRPSGQFARNMISLAIAMIILMVVAGTASARALPQLDKRYYHNWEEVSDYLHAVASHPRLRSIVKLMPVGYSREGRPLLVLRISKKGIPGRHPDKKPAALIMGAHHAREHVSKEAVLGLIDKIIHTYGKNDPEGRAVTYLVNAGTFYLFPWVNPDGGTNAFFHNPGQRKTNYPVDEPQIGAADCDTCGDGMVDGDSPDLVGDDTGILSQNGQVLAGADNGVISRTIQLWYENGNYDTPVLDERVARVQPGGSAYTFNNEGFDNDGDGLFSPYSGEDFVGGTDPNRNYGEPLWGDCANDEGCSWLSGSQTYSGPVPFSEPETAAVARFLRNHPNVVTVESLHSGINEVYPPWYIFPDPDDNATMDEAYQDAVGQYISQETGYEVVYGGQYAVKGDTTSYTYMGSSQNPDHGLDFFPGGVLSFTTEVYGMGSESGSAEAVKDWFPHHYEQFDIEYPQGMFIAWSDFPWCTTCDPAQMPGPLSVFNYIQYMDYFIFKSPDRCGGENYPGVFRCDYWGIADSTDYYADSDIFAYFNPPAANRHYEDWNSDGSALVRTVDRQLKHLLYRLYIAPFISLDAKAFTTDGRTLEIPVENTGLLRSSVMTTARNGEDPFTNRYYDYGLVDVEMVHAFGFSVNGEGTSRIGWLGGDRPDDPEPRVKTASFQVKGLTSGDIFILRAGSEKTGWITSSVMYIEGDTQSNGQFIKLWSNEAKRPDEVDTYFTGGPEMSSQRSLAKSRTRDDIRSAMARAQEKRDNFKRIEGPFTLVPGKAEGIIVKKYH